MDLALCGRRLIGWIGASLLSASLLSAPSLRRHSSTKPNILFIMGDDIGWMQVGATNKVWGSAKRPILTASPMRAPGS